jgi:MinD-like ATPase involved in chromosome partitioning or flagellar assembly
MPIVAVAGDACTTTTVAVAATWPLSEETLIVEADPTGGDLAAWLDVAPVPSLSTVVTAVPDGSWGDIERYTRLSPSGLRLIPAPARAGEAHQAVSESARAVVPTLAAMRMPVTIVDTGALLAKPGLHPFVGAAAVTVLVHRQSTQSAAAAAVRLQRLAEQAVELSELASVLIVAIVGSTPFEASEIAGLLRDSGVVCEVVPLPVDELAAAVYAGRTGVSPRRLERLPLTRDAAALTKHIRAALHISAGIPSERWG